MPRRFAAVPIALILALAACGVGDDHPRAINPAPTLVAAMTTLPPTTTAVATTTVTETSVAEVTTTAVTTTLPPTTAAAEGIVLGETGLGVVEFGTEAEAALASITAELGPPSDDSGYVPALASPFGVCPGEEVRGVRYGPLQVLVGDVGTGTRQIFSYLYATSLIPVGETPGASSGLTTEAGLGLGQTVAQLKSLYPGAIVASDLFGPTYSTSADGGLSGTVTAVDDSGLVTSVIGGTFCGE